MALFQCGKDEITTWSRKTGSHRLKACGTDGITSLKAGASNKKRRVTNHAPKEDIQLADQPNSHRPAQTAEQRGGSDEIWNLDNLLLNRVLDQLRLVVNIQLAHQVELVSFHSFHAQIQIAGDFLHRISFR